MSLFNLGIGSVINILMVDFDDIVKNILTPVVKAEVKDGKGDPGSPIVKKEYRIGGKYRGRL